MNLFKVCIIISTALLLSACGSDQPDTETAQTTPAGFSDSLVIELAGADSVTVLDLVRGSHQVAYRTTLSGAFVTAIDSIENGGDYFWVYTVNDIQVSLACDDCYTSDNDRVKWHFRKFGE